MTDNIVIINNETIIDVEEQVSIIEVSSSGVQGPAGPSGIGVPSGGTAGQYLTKVNATSYNTQWSTIDLSGKQDVVSGVSNTEISYLDGLSSNIQNQLDAKLSSSAASSIYAPIDSPTFTGNVTLAQSPTSDLHAATKLYVDNVTAGINFHQAVHVATTTNLDANYNNGNNGIGATLIAATNGAWTSLDGHTSFNQYDRILVKNQTDPKQNGIYILSDFGSSSSKWVLTRASDADNNPTGEMKPGDFTFVQNGTVNASIGYINSSTANPIVIGVNNISYTEFNAGKTVVAGNGLQEATPGIISIDTSITQTRVSGVTDAEIGYLDGVTSAIQTQLNGKLESSDIAGLATEEYVDNAVSGVTIDISTAAGANIDWNASTLQFDAVIPEVNAATPTTLGTVYGKIDTGTYVDDNQENTGLGYNVFSDTNKSNISKSTAVGFNSVKSGYENTALGYKTLENATDNSWDNIAIGTNALNALTNDSHNIAIGYYASNTMQTSSYNIAIGAEAMRYVGTDIDNSNIAIGHLAMSSVGSGGQNIAIGKQSLDYSNGNYNIAIGTSTGYSLTGSNNIIVGTNASASSFTVSNEITLGDSNITKFRIPGLGIDWTSSNIPAATLGSNTFTADQTVNNIRVGRGPGNDPTNTAFGNLALSSFISTPTPNIGMNVAIGGQALKSSTNGFTNIAIGYNALQAMEYAYQNVAVGTDSLFSLTTGQRNTAVGHTAMQNSTTASDNTAFGRFALGECTTGNDNTALGRSAGGVQTGSNNTVIGFNAKASTTSVSNQITLGNSSISTIRAQVTSITGLSDARDKKNIEPLNVGLDFVNKLNPVKFQWNMRDGGKVDVPDSGFIAQELIEVEDETGLADYLMLTFRDNPEKLEATAGRLIPILVKAIQDLSNKVKSLEAQIS